MKIWKNGNSKMEILTLKFRKMEIWNNGNSEYWKFRKNKIRKNGLR